MNRSRAAAVTLAAAAVLGGVAYVARRAGARRRPVGETALAAVGRDLPGDLEHHFVPVDDGGVIHAVERGKGLPIVLVHGVSLGVATWAPQLHQLAGHHRVIAIGQRGHGQSVAGEGGYRLERLADDLLVVLAALEVNGAVLVGHSMGGMVCQLLAVTHPHELRRHVAGLVLVATSAGPVVPGPGGAALRAAMVAVAVRGLGHSERRGKELVPRDPVGAWITRTCFGSHPRAADVQLTRSMLDAMSPTAMAGLMGPLLSFDVRRELVGLDWPTHVVVGSRDLLTPPRMARVMAGAISDADLTIFSGCGHMVMLERAEELNDLLGRFAGALATAGR